VGPAVELFESPGLVGVRRFDVSPDGQRLLLFEPEEIDDGPFSINVLVNWPAVLAER
jgi:hypothetical protein